MNCPRCQAALPPDARFCPACGAAVALPTSTTEASEPAAPPAPTEQELAELRARLAEQRLQAETWLDNFLRAGGAEDPAELTDEDGVRRFNAGTIQCDAAVLEEDNQLYLHVDALLMNLPSDHELILPLMREILELNVTLRGSVRLGIRGEQIIATAIRPINQLTEEELAETVAAVIALSDRIDEQLITRYGGTVIQRQSTS